MKRGVFIIGQQPPLKQIEKEIRSLVYLLNQAPYIQTHASCSGHPNMQKREWKDGWITIKPVGNPEKLWDFSESLLARLDKRSRRASSGNLNSFQWCWDLVRHVHEILGQEEEFQPQEDGRRQFLAHGRFVLRPVVKNAPVERTREEHLKIWKLIELTARELIHGEMYSEAGALEVPAEQIAEGLDENIIGSDDTKPVDVVREEAESARKLEVAAYVESIFIDAVRQGASEIHITPFEQGMVIRYMVDAGLVEAEEPPEDIQLAIIDRIKLISGMDVAQKSPQKGAIGMRITSVEKLPNMRVSCLPSRWGEAVTITIL